MSSSDMRFGFMDLFGIFEFSLLGIFEARLFRLHHLSTSAWWVELFVCCDTTVCKDGGPVEPSKKKPVRTIKGCRESRVLQEHNASVSCEAYAKTQGLVTTELWLLLQAATYPLCMWVFVFACSGEARQATLSLLH